MRNRGVRTTSPTPAGCHCATGAAQPLSGNPGNSARPGDRPGVYLQTNST